MELVSKTQTTIFSNVPYILTKETIFLFNLNTLQINAADVAVLTAGSHNYDENIKRSLIKFAIKFVKDSQSLND